jgi:hypothetical protein
MKEYMKPTNKEIALEMFNDMSKCGKSLMTLKEIEQLAETQWEGCQGCDENDKYFWISGFVQGYLSAKIDNVDDRIEANRGKIADILINGLDCHYSGLPSPKSYDI